MVLCVMDVDAFGQDLCHLVARGREWVNCRCKPAPKCCGVVCGHPGRSDISTSYRLIFSLLRNWLRLVTEVVSETSPFFKISLD